MCLIAAWDDNQRVIPKRNQKGWWYICLPSHFYKCGPFFGGGLWFSEWFQAVVLRFGPIPSVEAIKHGRYRAAKNKKEVIWIDDLHVGFNCSMLFCQSFSSHGLIKFTIDVPSIESQLDVFGTNVAQECKHEEAWESTRRSWAGTLPRCRKGTFSTARGVTLPSSKRRLGWDMFMVCQTDCPKARQNT